MITSSSASGLRLVPAPSPSRTGQRGSNVHGNARSSYAAHELHSLYQAEIVHTHNDLEQWKNTLRTLPHKGHFLHSSQQNLQEKRCTLPVFGNNLVQEGRIAGNAPKQDNSDSRNTAATVAQLPTQRLHTEPCATHLLSSVLGQEEKQYVFQQQQSAKKVINGTRESSEEIATHSAPARARARPASHHQEQEPLEQSFLHYQGKKNSVAGNSTKAYFHDNTLLDALKKSYEETILKLQKASQETVRLANEERDSLLRQMRSAVLLVQQQQQQQGESNEANQGAPSPNITEKALVELLNAFFKCREQVNLSAMRQCEAIAPLTDKVAYLKQENERIEAQLAELRQSLDDAQQRATLQENECTKMRKINIRLEVELNKANARGRTANSMAEDAATQLMLAEKRTQSTICELQTLRQLYDELLVAANGREQALHDKLVENAQQARLGNASAERALQHRCDETEEWKLKCAKLYLFVKGKLGIDYAQQCAAAAELTLGSDFQESFEVLSYTSPQKFEEIVAIQQQQQYNLSTRRSEQSEHDFQCPAVQCAEGSNNNKNNSACYNSGKAVPDYEALKRIVLLASLLECCSQTAASNTKIQQSTNYVPRQSQLGELTFWRTKALALEEQNHSYFEDIKKISTQLEQVNAVRDNLEAQAEREAQNSLALGREKHLLQVQIESLHENLEQSKKCLAEAKRQRKQHVGQNELAKIREHYENYFKASIEQHLKDLVAEHEKQKTLLSRQLQDIIRAKDEEIELLRANRIELEQLPLNIEELQKELTRVHYRLEERSKENWRIQKTMDQLQQENESLNFQLNEIKFQRSGEATLHIYQSHLNEVEEQNQQLKMLIDQSCINEAIKTKEIVELKEERFKLLHQAPQNLGASPNRVVNSCTCDCSLQNGSKLSCSCSSTPLNQRALCIANSPHSYVQSPLQVSNKAQTTPQNQAQVPAEQKCPCVQECTSAPLTFQQYLISINSQAEDEEEEEEEEEVEEENRERGQRGPKECCESTINEEKLNQIDQINQTYDEL